MSVNAMPPKRTRLSKIAIQALVGLLCLYIRPASGNDTPIGPSLRIRKLPRTTLWAWERPEDLHAVNPATTAVAYLDQTILLGPSVISEPRRQPLAYPGNATRIAVVRIQALPGTNFEPDYGPKVVDLLLQSAERPGIAALQVDFDATRSQRDFYTKVLRELRSRMPPDLPLSITALASWCSYDDWIAGLPVDEAVPMFFRMEPDRRRAPPDAPQFLVREPLCKGSVGVSMHEIWPEGVTTKRVYVFADRGWNEDLALLTERKLP